MLKRVAVVAITIAPVLPMPAWAQATPDQAASLQQQIGDWFRTSVGVTSKSGHPLIGVKADGDHYEISMPLGSATDAPMMTGKMTDAGNGKWAVDDMKAPSPSVFHYQLPPSKAPGVVGGDVVSTMTMGEQQQHMLIDPTLATPSTTSSTIKDMQIVATSADAGKQTIHIDSGNGDASLTPAGTGRSNFAANSTVSGYTMKMAGKDGPVDIRVGKISIVANATDMSNSGGLGLLRTVAEFNPAYVSTQTAAPAPGTAATPKNPAVAMLVSFTNLAKSVSIDEKLDNFEMTIQGKTGSLDTLALNVDTSVNDGKLKLRMPIGANGLTLPDLGLGGLASFIPSKLSLTPMIENVPPAALINVMQKSTAKQDLNDEDIAAVFAKGPVTAGIDDFALDVSGSSFAGKMSVVATSPGQFTGTGTVTAENLDKLQQSLAANPQTAQFAAVVIFLKGIGRVDQGRMVWDVAYDGARVVVNGQDMSALMGAAAGSAPPPAARPRPMAPQGTSPAHPGLRPAPNRP